MAPLGVLTAIVGAIRVKGAPWLKRVIGRARENTGLVELKLKSSVSHDVCELWNGTSIVRTLGNAQINKSYTFRHMKEIFPRDRSSLWTKTPGRKDTNSVDIRM